jgi:DNA-directed RNA polymerase subunit RPC12/RpoP
MADKCVDCGTAIEGGTRRERCLSCGHKHRLKVSAEWKKNNPTENARHVREHRKRKDDPK